VRRRRRRSSRLPRIDWRSLRRPLPKLVGEAWFIGGRGPQSARVVDHGVRWRRALALSLAAAELALLIVALAYPALRVRQIEVSGERRVPAAQVLAASRLGDGQSIFTVDPRAVQADVRRSTWIRSAQVSAQLPDRVVIRVDEWQPVAVYQPGAGRAYYLSDQAVALGPLRDGDNAGTLLPILGPPSADLRPGRRALDPQLLTALVNIQRTLPRLIGQDVKSFTMDACGNLTMLSSRGWQAQFGRMLTGEEIGTLHDKVAALRAVAPTVDYNSSDLLSVNVMNPAAVAVRNKPKSTPTPAPSPSPSASASPAASPAPAPSANPRSGPVRIPTSPSPSGSAAPAAGQGSASGRGQPVACGG
jgi:cell division septal protein FtsQ